MAVELVVEPRKVFSNTSAEQGEGSLIAVKIALQAFAGVKKLLVFSPGSLAENSKYLAESSLVSGNPLESARGLAAASRQKILVFAGDAVTSRCISLFSGVKDGGIKENITYICCNNAGSSSSGSLSGIERQLSRLVSAGYVASASVAFPEDYMRKLLKSVSCNSLSFLEVHCPSPRLWGFDPSDTIEVGRVAVNSGIWPLFEAAGGSLRLTVAPEGQDTAEMYARMQRRFSAGGIENLRSVIEENSKLVGAAK